MALILPCDCYRNTWHRAIVLAALDSMSHRYWDIRKFKCHRDLHFRSFRGYNSGNTDMPGRNTTEILKNLEFEFEIRACQTKEKKNPTRKIQAPTPELTCQRLSSKAQPTNHSFPIQASNHCSAGEDFRSTSFESYSTRITNRPIEPSIAKS